MSEIRHTPVHLKFREPFVTARGRVESRRGFLLGLAANGQRWVSEVTLLPEFGTEYFEHAERVLEGESMMMPSAPATVFGLDCLRFALEKERHHSVKIAIAYLFPSGNVDETLQAAQYAALLGHTSLKLKVIPSRLDEVIDITNRISIDLPQVRLRLDANGSLSEQDFELFLSRAKLNTIEWIEDPFPMTDSWAKVSAECGIRFACDEALSAKEIGEQEKWTEFSVLVIKPSRIGSIDEVIRICTEAQKRKKQVVFSSMYDSTIGLSYLAHLADFVGTEIAQGLGVQHLLAEGTTRDPMPIQNGNLIVPPLSDLSLQLHAKYAEKLWPK